MDTKPLTLQIPESLYKRYKQWAEQTNRSSDLGKSPQELVQELIISQLGEPEEEVLSERERGRRALMAGGLLTDLGPELKKMANQNTISLEQAQQILGAAQGKPLSEIIVEQRG